MMTKQAELKQQAYASNLKSRALSVLIYLIDRSNADLTCFPAIPTMAVQLHISVSTVKRALKELVNAGFLQKDSRFRENNRGQTSNLYTLIFREEVPTPDNDNNPNRGDFIEPVKKSTPADECKVERITFATIASKQNQCNHQPEEIADDQPIEYAPKPCIYHIDTPAHRVLLNGLKRLQIFSMAKENAGQFLSCVSDRFMWMGVGVNLQPP
jgi:predicted transcriptional regulator